MARFGLDWEKHNLLNSVDDIEIIEDSEVFTQDMPVDVSLENTTVSMTPNTVSDEIEVSNIGDILSDDENSL